MNRRRELALQRVSRIGSIAAADNISQNTKYKSSHTGARFQTNTIEAALGTYLMRNNEIYDLRGQDAYVHGYGESGSEAQDQLSRQMKEYVSMASAEENQLANAKSDLERRIARHITTRNGAERILTGLTRIAVLVFYCILTIRWVCTAYWESI